MPRELERQVVALVKEVLDGEEQTTPSWLQRPDAADCGRRWAAVKTIYRSLTGLDLPDVMPPRERRTVDLVIGCERERVRIVEVDESQHFNEYRALTFRAYPRSARVCFDRAAWLRACAAKRRLEGGGFGKPKPPLFPGEGGRHQQRAFVDALCDILPPVHGWLPTLRIADFEVARWIQAPDALDRMAGLLRDRSTAA
jgi:hypothetical protein